MILLYLTEKQDVAIKIYCFSLCWRGYLGCFKTLFQTALCFFSLHVYSLHKMSAPSKSPVNDQDCVQFEKLKDFDGMLIQLT